MTEPDTEINATPPSPSPPRAYSLQESRQRAIARDFGLVPGVCTREFCDALLAAIACYDGSAAAWWEDMQRKSEQFRQEQEDDTDSDQLQREAGLYPHQTLGFSVDERPVDPCRDAPGRGRSRRRDSHHSLLYRNR